MNTETVTDWVLGLFASLPATVQAVLLIVLLLVTVAAHVAPYTQTKKDDFLFLKKNILLVWFGRIFKIVAGNYGRAKNAPDVDKLIDTGSRLKTKLASAQELIETLNRKLLKARKNQAE